jgi:CubicO group peptidase (beta-lactamase class C family)
LSCESYGYGWALGSLQNRSGGLERYIAHNGAISGFRSASWYLPDHHLYLVVLTNFESLDASYILDKVRDAADIG